MQVGDSSAASTVREVNIAWDVSKRAVVWQGLSSPHQVEFARLFDTQYLMPSIESPTKNDHGAFSNKATALRPLTAPAFLSSVPSGGCTSFPKLATKIQPREGGAIVWSYELPDGSAGPDMMHAGEPPGKEGIKKYALNVWIMREGEGGNFVSVWKAGDTKKQEL